VRRVDLVTATVGTPKVTTDTFIDTDRIAAKGVALLLVGPTIRNPDVRATKRFCNAL
jgi:hypothetical protein